MHLWKERFSMVSNLQINTRITRSFTAEMTKLRVFGFYCSREGIDAC